VERELRDRQMERKKEIYKSGNDKKQMDRWK
jgi:hypothetical protein